jgi:hypothetical protein
MRFPVKKRTTLDLNPDVYLFLFHDLNLSRRQVDIETVIKAIISELYEISQHAERERRNDDLLEDSKKGVDRHGSQVRKLLFLLGSWRKRTTAPIAIKRCVQKMLLDCPDSFPFAAPYFGHAADR